MNKLIAPHYLARIAHHLLAAVLLACVWLLVSQAVLGQSADEKKGDYWYQVEMIVFARAGDGNDEEIWRTDLQLDYPLNWLELVSPVQPPTADDAVNLKANAVEIKSAALLDKPVESDISPVEPAGERALMLLPEAELTLTAEAHRLDRSQRYRVIFHSAWRQALAENREEPSVLISGGELFNHHHELEGSINLYRRTYLHIETDLWLSRFTTNFGQEHRPWPPLPWPPNRALERGTAFKIDDGLLRQFSQYGKDEYAAILAQPYVVENIVVMQQERRMRSNELHYIDHPQLGILVKLTPYQPPPAEPKHSLSTSPVEQP
jgi:hypothetical protein